MFPINCEINFLLIRSLKFFVINSIDSGAFAITDSKLHVSVGTLPTEENTKLPRQLKSGFKKTYN